MEPNSKNIEGNYPSTKGSTPGNSKFLYFFFVASLASKFLLFADFDTSAIGGAHDDYWCIQRAIDGYWGTFHYDQYHAIKEPLWPLVMLALQFVGIPARIWIEVMYFGICLFAVRSMFIDRARSPALQALVFSLLFWNPFAVPVFERSTYDAFFSFLLILSMTLWARGMFDQKKREGVMYYVAIGGSLGLLALVRAEGMLLGYVGVLSSACLAWGAGLSAPITRLRAASKAGAVVLATFYITQMPVRIANWHVFGTHAIAELEEPSYKRAMLNLAMIAPTSPVPQISIPMESLERAAKFSHEGQVLLNGIKGSAGRGWLGASQGYPVPKDEIGGGWMIFALRDAAAEAGAYSTPAEARAFYTRLSESLEIAFANGSLPKRKAVHPMVGPRPPIAKILNSTVILLKDCIVPKQFLPVYDVPIPSVINDYDRALNRKVRSIERMGAYSHVEGVYFREADIEQLESVRFVDKRFGVNYQGKVIEARNDKLPDGRFFCGFSLDIPSDLQGMITFLDKKGTKREIAMDGYALKGLDGRETANFRVIPSTEFALGRYIIARYKFAFIVWDLLLAIIVSTALWQLVSGRYSYKVALWTSTVVIPLVLTRLLICSIIDSGAYFTRSQRYEFPISLATSFAIAILVMSYRIQKEDVLEQST